MINELSYKELLKDRKQKILSIANDIGFIRSHKEVIEYMETLNTFECEEYLNSILKELLLEDEMISLLYKNKSNIEFFKALEIKEISNDRELLIFILKQSTKEKQQLLRLAFEIKFIRENKDISKFIINMDYEELLHFLYKYDEIINNELISILIKNDSNYEFFKALESIKDKEILIYIARQDNKYKQRQLRLACEFEFFKNNKNYLNYISNLNSWLEQQNSITNIKNLELSKKL